MGKCKKWQPNNTNQFFVYPKYGGPEWKDLPPHLLPARSRVNGAENSSSVNHKLMMIQTHPTTGIHG